MSGHCVPAESAALLMLLALLCFILGAINFRRAGRSVRAILRRWELQPIWTENDAAEMRKLMRE